MDKLKLKIGTFIQDEDGLTTIEYAIAGGLLGTAIISGFTNMAARIAEIVTFVADALANVVI